jgi:hypothetical protein
MRKFNYVYYVQGYYHMYGWEDVDCHESRKDARAALRVYRENEPQYAHRIILRRELNEVTP